MALKDPVSDLREGEMSASRRVVARFAEAWRGGRTKIEPYLAEGPDDFGLLVELVQVDLGFRFSNGELVRVETYLERLPAPCREPRHRPDPDRRGDAATAGDRPGPRPGRVPAPLPPVPRVHTHLITCRAAIPLMLRTAETLGTLGLVVEMTDGTSQANAEFRRNVGFYYDLVKANVERIVKGLSAELEDSPVTAVGVTPGWLRSEKMLENFGVTEARNPRDACRERPGFGISESPTVAGQRRCCARRGRRRRPMGGHDRKRPSARRCLRRHRHRRKPAGLLGLSRHLRVGAWRTTAASTSSGGERAGS